jgi:hypothetical protein
MHPSFTRQWAEDHRRQLTRTAQAERAAVAGRSPAGRLGGVGAWRVVAGRRLVTVGIRICGDACRSTAEQVRLTGRAAS